MIGLQTPVHHFEIIDSTNEEARRLHAAGHGESCWLIADHQTAGRGRRGREWKSETGNFAATLFRPEAMPLAVAGHLSFVAGLAVQATIADLADAPVHLKWPNDVLVHGQKISGMLLEAFTISHNEIRGLAIGIGINLNSHPNDTPYPATHLSAHIRNSTQPDELRPRTILNRLAGHFADQLDRYQRHGFGDCRAAWLQRAYGVGDEVTIHLENQQLQGRFEGLDEVGQLQLKQPSGEIRLIAAGDIFFAQVGQHD